LLLCATLALGAYAVWLYVLHPPGKREPAASLAAPRVSATASAPKREPRETREPRPQPRPIEAEENEPYALRLAEAQELMPRDSKRALEIFQSVFRQSNMPAARSLLAHATVAVEEAAGKCAVTGLSRPRPFQLDAPSSRPTIARTSKGTIVSWVDNHLDPRARQAFTVLLDGSMRRRSLPISVTPEAHNVRQPQLLAVKDRLALLFWEEGGKEPGVYVRLLDAEGKIQSPPRKLSSARKSGYPTLAAAPNGEFWAVWEEDFESEGNDIVARKLGPELEPRGEAVRLTKLVKPRSANPPARTPDATVAHGALQIVFAKDLGNQRQVMLQTIALDDPKLARGLVTAPGKTKRRGKGPADEFLGGLRAVGRPSSKNAEPHLACPKTGCLASERPRR
jgi:hypothetical protein